MLLVAFLLAGTAVAFAVTQGLKQERSPVYGVRFDRVLGPHHPAHLRFKLRKRQKITVTVVDSDGAPSPRSSRTGRHGAVKLRWSGRTPRLGAGTPRRAVPLRVHLAQQRRDHHDPDRVPLRPGAADARARLGRPHVLTRGRRVVIRYPTDEPGQVILRVDGNRAVVTRPRVRARPFTWDGTVHGRPVAAGVHVLLLRAVDLVGNRSSSSRPLRVRVRQAAP